MSPYVWCLAEKALSPGRQTEIALGGRGHDGIVVVRCFAFDLQGRHPRLEVSFDGLALRTPAKVVTKKRPRLWMSEGMWGGTTWEGLTGSVLRIVNTGKHRVRVRVLCWGVKA